MGDDADQVQVSSTESNVVSMGLSGATGEAGKIDHLRDPILIWLSTTSGQYGRFAAQMRDGQVPQCLFWDPVKMDWAGDGCKVLDVRNGGEEMLCSCTHLTSFGAFAEEAEGTLPPTNFDVFTDFSYEGLRADNPTLWFVVSIFAVQITWVLTAIWADRHGYTSHSEERMKKA